MNARELGELLAEIERARKLLLYRNERPYSEAIDCWTRLSDLAHPARVALGRLEVTIERPKA